MQDLSDQVGASRRKVSVVHKIKVDLGRPFDKGPMGVDAVDPQRGTAVGKVALRGEVVYVRLGDLCDLGQLEHHEAEAFAVAECAHVNEQLEEQAPLRSVEFGAGVVGGVSYLVLCLLYTSPSPRDRG